MVVRRCTVSGYGSALAIGSEIGGGAASIFAEGITNPATSPALSLAFLLKSNTYRGSTISGVWLRNFSVACNLDALLITMRYGQMDLNGPYSPRFENINITGLTCRACRQALLAQCTPAFPTVGLRLENSVFTSARKDWLTLQSVQGFAMSKVTVNGKVPAILH